MSSRPRHAAVAVGAIVLLSAGVRFTGATGFAAPWIAPDEMIYGLVGQSLWETGELTVRGTPTAYYSLLTPALVGAPLTLDDLATGIRAAQALQALAMSLVAAPVFAWGRRLAGARWALAAAALAVLPPALWYGGLLMTEALYYPVVTAALFALARALEHPTALRQGVLLLAVTAAVAVRLQALVLVLALVVAVGLHAWFGRCTVTARRLAPVLVLLAVAGAGAAAVQGVAADTGWGDALGAYGTLATEAPSWRVGLLEASWHAGALVLMTFGLPVLATASVAVRAATGRETRPAATAFAAVATAYVALLLGQVSAFAVGYLDHVGERYLVTALPVLFLGLCAWLADGAPRTRGSAAVLGVGAVLLVATLPPTRLSVPEGLHDTFSTQPLLELAGGAAADRAVLTGFAALAAAAFVALPRRGLVAAVGAVGAGLVLLSVLTARDVGRLSRGEQEAAFGDADPSWIDAAGVGPVTLLDTGSQPWPASARTVFWNRSVDRALRLDGVAGMGPIPQAVVSLRPDGVLVDGLGRTLSVSRVAASATVTPAGARVAETPPTAHGPGWALWRVDGPLRIVSVQEGFHANGDFDGVARAVVYGCARDGALGLTLLGKEATRVAVRVNGLPAGTIRPRPAGVWTGTIAAPWYADGRGRCVFELDADGLTGSTRVEWLPGG